MERARFSPNALCTLALGSLLLATAPLGRAAGENDWPQWLGPHRDGCSTETGLLSSWPTQGPPLSWASTNIGAGYSGVSVVDGNVFTMGDGTDASYIFALNEADGKPLWQAKVGSTGGGNGYPGTRCTPTVSGDQIFALGQFGDLVCVERATGKEQWRKNLVSDFAGKMMSEWGYAESPLVDGEKVLCTPGGPEGTIIALDKKTGKELWRSKGFTDAAAYCSMLVEEIGGKRQYIQLTDASVAGVDASNGQLLWRGKRIGRTAVIATPVFWDDSVFVTSAYGAGCNLFKITSADGRFTATQVYANKVMSNHHGGVVRVGENLYGYSDGKGWVCQDFKTGKAVWEEKAAMGKGSILYADGHLYLRGEDNGTMALIEATPAGYKETGRFEQPQRSSEKAWPHPVIANGHLYLRDQSVLLSYKIKK